jgi:hypothetical protein
VYEAAPRVRAYVPLASYVGPDVVPGPTKSSVDQSPKPLFGLQAKPGLGTKAFRPFRTKL